MGEDTDSELVPGINKLKVLGGIVGALAVIVGATISFESRYAHADDIKTLISNQNETLRAIQTQQKQQLMYQIETWDFQIKKLEEQKKIVEMSGERNMVRRESQSNVKYESKPYVSAGPTPGDLQAQIDELKMKRDNAKKLLVAQ